MSYDLTMLKRILKPRFFRGEMPDATLSEFALLGSLQMDDDFSGKEYNAPIKYGHAQGRSRTFSDAVANNGTPRYAQWTLDVYPDYFNAQVPRKAALQTRTGEQYVKLFADAFVDGKAVVNENNAAALWGTSGGSRGKLNGVHTVTADHIQLSDPSMQTNFEEGMVVRASAASDGTGIVAGEVTLGKIDRVNGLLYTANGLNWDNAGNIPLITNVMYLYQDGDQALAPHGVADWLLKAMPTPGVLFNGVDRAFDQRLYGNYYDGRSYTVAEALRRALSFNRVMGGKADRVFMHANDYDNLEIDLVSTGFLRRETAPGSKGTFGFSGIEIDYGTGKAICIPDIKIPQRGTAAMLEMKRWHGTYMNGGKGPGAIIIDDDGQFIRMANEDTYDCRVGNYFELWCEFPGSSGLCDLQT